MRTHCITIDLANQGRRQVRARFDGGRMSSDGGALLLQAVDQRIGLTQNARRPAGGVFTLRQFAEQDGQSAPEPVPVDADMATRGDS